MKSPDYNTRLFSGGLRRWIHISRFRWLSFVLRKFNLKYQNIVELGCFDARSLDYLTGYDSYYGFDAGWEGGLNTAIKKYKSNNSINFKLCSSPNDFKLHLHSNLDLCISLETLEHLNSADLEHYLLIISQNLNGYFIVTVPNEKGFLFVLKYIFKLFIGGSEKYTLKEFFYAATGQCNKILQDNHKGFDYAILGDQLCKYFNLIYSSGVQFRYLPKFLNTQVGFVLKSK